MGKLGDNIKLARINKGITQKELADAIGATKAAISRYELGQREPRIETLQKIADALGVPVNELYDMGEEPVKRVPDNILPMPNMKKVPLLGTIACGEPILATENIEDVIDIPEEIHADFALRCKGDSMINARIFNGDIVYIRQQSVVENGEIAAVLIEEEATLKRVKLYDDHIALEPENPQYRPLVYWGEEMNSVRILGKAVAFTSIVR